MDGGRVEEESGCDAFGEEQSWDDEGDEGVVVGESEGCCAASGRETVEIGCAEEREAAGKTEGEAQIPSLCRAAVQMPDFQVDLQGISANFSGLTHSLIS